MNCEIRAIIGALGLRRCFLIVGMCRSLPIPNVASVTYKIRTQNRELQCALVVRLIYFQDGPWFTP